MSILAMFYKHVEKKCQTRSQILNQKIFCRVAQIKMFVSNEKGNVVVMVESGKLNEEEVKFFPASRGSVNHIIVVIHSPDKILNTPDTGVQPRILGNVIVTVWYVHHIRYHNNNIMVQHLRRHR